MSTVANNEISFKTWVRDAKTFVESTFSGRVYRVHGVDITLFPISVMAAAIGRDRETIVGWEQDGSWPKPMWAVPDKRTKRWYSRAQVVFAHTVHWELCRGNYGLSYSRHFPLLEFFTRVRAQWRTVDAETIKAAKEQRV